MSHEIYANDKMFSRVEIPWHRHENCIIVPAEFGTATAEEVCKMAGLDGKVELRQLYVPDTNNDTKLVECEGFIAVVEADTLKQETLGVHKTGYKPVQRVETVQWGDSLVQAGLAEWETAGTLKGRRVTFASLKTKIEGEVVSGDGVSRYIGLVDSYDGSFAWQVHMNDVRRVCMNTVRASIQSGGFVGKIRHSGSIQEQMEAAKDGFKNVSKSFHDQLKVYQQMAKVIVDASKADELLQKIIPDNPDAEKNTRTKNIREEIIELAHTGPGSDLRTPDGVPVGETLWGYLNGVTDWVDHWRSNDGKNANPTKSAESAILGSGNTLKSLALTTFRELAYATV